MRQGEDGAGAVTRVDLAAAGAAVFHAREHLQRILAQTHSVSQLRRLENQGARCARGTTASGMNKRIKCLMCEAGTWPARRDGGGGGRCGSAAGAEGARTTTVERVGVRVRSAMKPMPHASFSLAGSYSPTFFGAVVTPAVRCASADMAPTHGAKSPSLLLSDRSSPNLFVEMASLAKQMPCASMAEKGRE